MTKRKLKFLPQSEWVTRGLFAGPAVLQTRSYTSGEPVYRTVISASLSKMGDQLQLVLGTPDHALVYPIENKDDVTISERNGELYFTAYGKDNLVRAFQDIDGQWASQTRAVVPAESLEAQVKEGIAAASRNTIIVNNENLYAAVDEDTSIVRQLVYSGASGTYVRGQGKWYKLAADSEVLDDLVVYFVDSRFVDAFDKMRVEQSFVRVEDVLPYEVNVLPKKEETPAAPVTAAVDATCPPATQDIGLNLKNRKNAIDTAMYGPLNPAEPNDAYWEALAAEWNVEPEDARKQTCGNCAAFIVTSKMKNCIQQGLSDDKDEFDAIDAAGELGYCEAFDFKCAAARTCRAWIAGGPVTDKVEE